MKSQGIYKKIIAALMSVLLLTTTTGFSLEKHSCQHCGIKISLIIDIKSDLSSADSCCGNSSKMLNNSGQCDMNDRSCCSVESETHRLTKEFTSALSLPDLTPAIIILDNYYAHRIDSSINIPQGYDSGPPQYGGRTTIILNSQYRT